MDIEHLKYIGITAPHQILFILPEDYRDLRHPTRTFSELIPESRVVIEGTVTQAPAEPMGPGASLLAELSDNDGETCQIFLQGTYHDIKDILIRGARCYVYGHVNITGEGYALQQAALIDSVDIGHITPVYPSFSHTLRGSEVRDLVKSSFDTAQTQAVNTLRQLCGVDTDVEQRQFLARYGSRFDAFASLLKNLHYPGSPGAGFQSARVMKLIHAATVYLSGVIDTLPPVPVDQAMPEVAYCPYSDADYRDSGEIDTAYASIRDELDQRPPLRRVLSAEASTEHLSLIKRIIEVSTDNGLRVCVQIASRIKKDIKGAIVSISGDLYTDGILYDTDAHLYIVYTDHHLSIEQPPLDRHALIVDMGTPTRAIASYFYPGFTYTRLTQMPVVQPPSIYVTRPRFIQDVILRLSRPSDASLRDIRYVVARHKLSEAKELIASIQEGVMEEVHGEVIDHIIRWPLDEFEIYQGNSGIDAVVPFAEELSMFDLYAIKQWVMKGNGPRTIELIISDTGPEAERHRVEGLRSLSSGHQAIYQDVANTTYPPYTNERARKLLIGVTVTHADIETLLTQCRDPRIYLGKHSTD